MAYANAQAYKDAKFVQYWLDQLDGYRKEFKTWEKRCERIIKRYRDERQEKSDGAPDVNFKFNALWSNVQTLSPAVYKKAPKPIVERRYLDKDPIARFASMTLERSLEVTAQECGSNSATQRAVLDYLLVGRGVMWSRYEPTYGTPEDLGPQPSDDEGSKEPKADLVADDDDEEGEPSEAPRPVTWEKVYRDYVAWKNFRHDPAPVWEEVRWVAKREYMSRRELRTRFKAVDPETGRPIADLIPLQDQTYKDWDDRGKEKAKKTGQSAEVWEIWDKTNREVVFIATMWPHAPLERTPDPLSLQEFWPCAKPAYATTTNETLVPVPDYVEYQDQAEELDNLTARIKALTDAVRVNGVYDASIPELKRILQEGADNRLIAVQKWSELAGKGGLEKSIEFIPLNDIVEALLKLYEARDRVKSDMAEITGLSDIIRGQAQGSAKTATEQRIKGQFATLRLQDRQSEIARFCRDALAIDGEIIAEQFSPDILAQMTGMIPFITDELKNTAPPQPPAPPMQPGMGHNGGPPLSAGPQQPNGPQPPASLPAPGGAAPMMPPAPPDPQMIAQQIFQQAVELLKNDKMRTFRIDIETDSTIEVDKQAAKDSVVELFTAVGGFLEKALPIGQAMPQLTPALGQSILFAFRRFGAGRDVEGVWEQAIDQLSQMAKNPAPKPPSPEEMKAQAEMKKSEMENQRMAAQAQIDQQKGQQELQIAQAKNEMDMQRMHAELQIKQQELALDQERLAMEERKMQLEMAHHEHQSQIDGAMSERKHELGLEVMAAKAEQAMKPKPQANA